MEEAFEKLKKQGKTDVESLIQWMKDSKIIDDAKAAEDKARAYFSDVADTTNVEVDKFKQALGEVAKEQKKNVEDLKNMLAEQKPRFMNALMAGASAFKDAFTKK